MGTQRLLRGCLHGARDQPGPVVSHETLAQHGGREQREMRLSLTDASAHVLAVGTPGALGSTLGSSSWAWEDNEMDI